MKLYNLITDKVSDHTLIETAEMTYIAAKLSEVELNALGYYYVQYVSVPDRRYYTYVKNASIIGDKYVVDHIATERPLYDVQTRMLKDLREVYIELGIKPRLDSTLGYDIFGGRSDIEDFQMWKDYAETEIIDADGDFQSVTGTSYDTFATVIKTYRRLLFTTGKTKTAEVKAFTTIGQCINYENDPYDYTITAEDVLQNPDLVEGTVITRYRNNITDWQLD